jgi:hypothetical protein
LKGRRSSDLKDIGQLSNTKHLKEQDFLSTVSHSGITDSRPAGSSFLGKRSFEFQLPRKFSSEESRSKHDSGKSEHELIEQCPVAKQLKHSDQPPNIFKLNSLKIQPHRLSPNFTEERRECLSSSRCFNSASDVKDISCRPKERNEV